MLELVLTIFAAVGAELLLGDLLLDATDGVEEEVGRFEPLGANVVLVVVGLGVVTTFVGDLVVGLGVVTVFTALVGVLVDVTVSGLIGEEDCDSALVGVGEGIKVIVGDAEALTGLGVTGVSVEGAKVANGAIEDCCLGEGTLVVEGVASGDKVSEATVGWMTGKDVGYAEGVDVISP